MTSFLISAIIIINEVMAANVGDVMSPATNFDSWIELYNPSNEPVSLGGMYLSDTQNDLKRWRMYSYVGTVPANGFLVVWLGSDEIDDAQAPFKLNCDGGTIYLSDENGQLITSQDYPKAMSHTSYARKTDGGDEWGLTATPTPGASNRTASFATERLAAPVVDTDSKLFTGSLTVQVKIPEGTTLMYSTDGSLPQAPTASGGQENSPWTEMIVNGDCEGDDATCFVSRDGNGNGDKNRIVDGVGYNGSRGIQVHAIANAQEDWSSQFFVFTPNHVWSSGDKYRFRMKVRADHACHISVQSHKNPGNYIYWSMLAGGYDVTTEWKEISYEGTITNDQAGTNSWWPTPSELRTIAFNLNELKSTDNNIYFDDISWEASSDDLVTVVSLQSQDGKFTIDNTTNLTLRLFRDGYLPSVPVTRSYIKTSQQYSIPVVSIVGDTRYFKDPMWGIDIEGSNGISGNGRDDAVNWNQPWDRPVNFSYITPDGKMAFNQDANISVSGGWTRMITPRSMKLKANKKFDGQNRFDYAFFAQKPYIRNKTLVLRNGGNDVWETHSRFMDLALETIMMRSGINLDVQAFTQVAEYINGEFKGIVNLREPSNDKYVDANFGYDDEEIDMFENFNFKNGNDEVLKRILDLSARINDSGAYDELQQLLDIDEFSYYMAAELFLTNNDWPDNNVKAFRSQKDGRYRFISFDLDYAFNREDPFSSLNNFKSVKLVKLFVGLLDNDIFRKRFIDTFCLMAGSVFEKDKATAIVNELADEMRPMSKIDGFTPDGAADKIKNKLKTWQDKMIKCLQKYQPMQLSNASAQNVVLNTDTKGARIFVNDIEVPYAELKGYLFAPAKLRAQAPAGYRFDGWKNGSETVSTATTIDLPSGNVNLTASFSALSADQQKSSGITPVRINEVSAANGIYINDYWKRNDWIELYNTTDEDIDVEGMYLSDNPQEPRMYQITKDKTSASTIIPAHGHLVIWCDNQEPISQLHASFKLDADGGEVLLTAADGSWSDQLTYPLLDADETAGRWPDGCADVFVMNIPTIERANLRTSYLTSVEQSGKTGISDTMADNTDGLSVTYAAGSLAIAGNGSGSVLVHIHNLAGQTVANITVQLNGGIVEVPLTTLSDGVYVAAVSDAKGHKTNCKFIK